MQTSFPRQFFEVMHRWTRRRLGGGLGGVFFIAGFVFVGFGIGLVVGFKAEVVCVCRTIARSAVRMMAGMALKAMMAAGLDGWCFLFLFLLSGRGNVQGLV